jgi:NADH-quinone oxidoreductase subunit J
MPTFTDFFFYVLSALVLVFGFLCVANPISRNPVTSAMFLVLTIGAMAGLFVLLHAFFLAAVQVLVYAGAVMVLFLFVIMLLNLKEEERRKIKKFNVGVGSLLVLAVAGLLVRTLGRASALAPAAIAEGVTKPLGGILFSAYVLPFEVMSLLLLVAMVGAILLSKKDLA